MALQPFFYQALKTSLKERNLPFYRKNLHILYKRLCLLYKMLGTFVPKKFGKFFHFSASKNSHRLLARLADVSISISVYFSQRLRTEKNFVIWAKQSMCTQILKAW